MIFGRDGMSCNALQHCSKFLRIPLLCLSYLCYVTTFFVVFNNYSATPGNVLKVFGQVLTKVAYRDSNGHKFILVQYVQIVKSYTFHNSYWHGKEVIPFLNSLDLSSTSPVPAIENKKYLLESDAFFFSRQK